MNSPHHLQWLELSQSALAHNVRSLKRLAGDRLFAVCVKANAYGHGLREIISLLTKLPGVDYVTVHSVEEARLCRSSGWTREIIVLGPVSPGEVSELFDFDLQPTVVSTAVLEQIGQESDKREQAAKIHLKLETGTNRQGITENEIKQFAAVFKKYKHLGRPFGLSTHFANIEDTTDHSFAEEQLKEFNRLVACFSKAGLEPTVCHTACSAALILFDKTKFDLVRPGISVYGHWSSKETYLSYRLTGGENDIFHPVLSWRARITQIKNIPADSFVGYGCTYRTNSVARLAIIPVGYYDGYSRALSNRAYVLIKGRRAPVRGRICMNLMMVDISDIEEVKLGDVATLIGSDVDQRVTPEQLADWCGTINYEILARISPKIIRCVSD